MNRRYFLKALAATGMSLSLPIVSTPLSAAADPNRFWVMVNASGGWDPTSLCDPKGNALRSDGRGPINNFATAAIRTAGNINFAPYADTITAPAEDTLAEFFTRHSGRMQVINGIDTGTNSHSVGSRFVWSGKSDMGNPSLAAMIAASAAPNKAMSYISNGGYDFTDSIVSASRVSGSGNFSKLAFPNEPSPGNSDRYYEDGVYDLIQQAQMASLRRQSATEVLAKRRKKLNELLSARSGTDNLDQIVQKLPSPLSSGLKGQAEMAAAAFASGLSVSANLNVGGFDTHGNHDNRQTSSLDNLLDGVNHLWAELERQGIQDRTTIMIGSDFGRTPFYNGYTRNSGDVTGTGGKDHWNVTSVIVMGAGITGNRVIGGTDDLFNARKVNPSTLAFDDNGILITPAHIHKALRRATGLAGTELDRLYPVAVDDIPLFT
ncbi:DUF1501 domain-containing protein [Alkalimarinus sediminis]|uniref:DUF1501 domain-containing protein n=1 Tax=Alkalimarinus sediminis TaxID=1632866 RepID=A0A9E8HKZ6_9ALTE|nr:DUF1501 domain-containing protein [Alkalimarinus sediminis]UZW75267.1 DUF1501 domain-containing protein [Alkalimarinus sediminis]